MQTDAVAGVEADWLRAAERIGERHGVRPPEQHRLGHAVDEVVRIARLGEGLHHRAPVVVVEADDLHAGGAAGGEPGHRGRQQRLQDSRARIVRRREDRQGLARALAQRDPVEIDLGVLVDDDEGAGGEIHAHQRAAVARMVGQHPQTAAVGGDAEHPRLHLLEVERQQRRPAVVAPGLEHARVVGAVTQAGGRPPLPVGQPLDHVARILGDQRRLAAVQLDSPQIEDRRLATVGGDDDVPRLTANHAGDPRAAARPRREIARQHTGRLGRGQIEMIVLVAVGVLGVQDPAAVGRPDEAADTARRARLDDPDLTGRQRAKEDRRPAAMRGHPGEPAAVRRDAVVPVRLVVRKEPTDGHPPRRTRRPVGRRWRRRLGRSASRDRHRESHAKQQTPHG